MLKIKGFGSQKNEQKKSPDINLSFHVRHLVTFLNLERGFTKHNHTFF